MQEENQSADNKTQNTVIDETTSLIDDTNMTTYPELQSKDSVMAAVEVARKQRSKRNMRRMLIVIILVFSVILYIMGSIATKTNNFGLAVLTIIPTSIIAISTVLLIAMVANEKIRNHYDKKAIYTNKTKYLLVAVETIATSVITLPFFAVFAPPYRLGLMVLLIFIGISRYLTTNNKETALKYFIPAALMLIMFLLFKQNIDFFVNH